MKTLLALAVAILLVGGLAPAADAYSTYYTSRCASCHSDDSPTCDGCHAHKGSLSAAASQPQYGPGDPVVVTFDGGEMGGWIRALLYDHNGLLLDEAQGPSGTGDDGLGNAVTFAVELGGMAPTEPGDFVWETTWFGGLDSGAGHVEASVTVDVHVGESSTSLPGEPLDANWDWIKALY